jgi:hypothetical protein
MIPRTKEPDPPMPNCRFVLENSETEDWPKELFHSRPDYVHLRNMGPCFTNFATMMEKVYDYMRPGGWIELQDVDWHVYSDDGTASGTVLERFFQTVGIGGAAMGRDMYKARSYKATLEEAGFVDVVEQQIPVPLSPWPLNARWRRIAYYAATAITEAMDSYRKFFVAAGLRPDEIDELAAGLKRDVLRKDIRPYCPM